MHWSAPRPRDVFSLRKQRGRQTWDILREGVRLGYTLTYLGDMTWACREAAPCLTTYVTAPDAPAAMIKAMEHLGFIETSENLGDQRGLPGGLPG